MVVIGKLMSAVSVEQHLLANAIGWGQNWAEVKRSGNTIYDNTIYDNTTGRPILILYHATSSSQCALSVSAPRWRLGGDVDTVSVAARLCLRVSSIASAVPQALSRF